MGVTLFSRQQKKRKTNRLLLREWLALALILGFLGAVSLIASYSNYRTHKTLQEYIPYEKRVIEVEIKGSVAKPGVYSCAPGTSLKELLEKAEITERANFRKTPFKKIFFTSESIEIPEKKGRNRRGKKISLEEN